MEHIDELYIAKIDLNIDNMIDESIHTENLLNLGECDIIIYGNEGKIPHFHIVSNDKKFNCCVCIHQPRYFIHGNKTDKLSSKQRKILDSLLRKNPKYRNDTLWTILAYEWNYSNPNNVIQMNDYTKQPDYTKMTDSIHL